MLYMLAAATSKQVAMWEKRRTRKAHLKGQEEGNGQTRGEKR